MVRGTLLTSARFQLFEPRIGTANAGFDFSKLCSLYLRMLGLGVSVDKQFWATYLVKIPVCATSETNFFGGHPIFKINSAVGSEFQQNYSDFI